MAMTSTIPIAPVRSPAPADLTEFLTDLKTRGVRSYQGDFVASDGTRIAVNVVFEREPPPARKRERDE